MPELQLDERKKKNAGSDLHTLGTQKNVKKKK